MGTLEALWNEVRSGVIKHGPKGECFDAKPVENIMLRVLSWVNKTNEDSVVISHCVLRLCCFLDQAKPKLKCFDRSLLNSFLDGSLTYAIMQWDHYIEAVRNESCQVIDHILSSHTQLCNICSNETLSLNCPTVLRMTHHLSQADCSVRSKYRILKSILNRFSLFTIPQLLSHFTKESNELDSTKAFAKMLLFLAGDQTISPVVGELYSYLSVRFNSTGNEHFAYWTEYLCQTIVCSQDDRIVRGLTQRYLPQYLCTDVYLQECIKSINNLDSTHNTLSFVMACCSAAMRHKNRYMNEWTTYLDEATMKRALVYSDVQVRSSALELLCACPKPTVPLSLFELKMFRAFLICNINELDSAFRQKILNGVKKVIFPKIFIRMRDSGNHMLKYGNGQEFNAELQYYDEWFDWLLSFLIYSSLPEANSGRRTSALNILKMILFENYLAHSGNCRLWGHLHVDAKLPSMKLCSNMYLCLLDPYEQNQEMALQILIKLNHNYGLYPDNLEEMVHLAWIYAVSPKPIHSVSASFFFRLICNLKNCSEIVWTHLAVVSKLVLLLEEHVNVAEGDLIEAAEHAPMHGILYCVNSLLYSIDWSCEDLDKWRELVENKLLGLCLRACVCVSTIVHSMSPEGLLPVPMEDVYKRVGNEGDMNVVKKHSSACQTLLVCCWRTQKETSAVFSSLCQRAPVPQVLTSHSIDKFVEFFWMQLTECKHRGAFETGYTGFIKLCERVWGLDEGCEGICRPHWWIHRLMNQMNDEDSLGRLCATRRSAGLPYLVLAITVTEPCERGHCSFQFVTTVLLSMAGDKQAPMESRLHALNMLKALFRESILGEASMSFAGTALLIVFDALDAPIWAIQNAASQLFSVLILRVFGVPRFKNESIDMRDSEVGTRKLGMTSHEFFNRFPQLHLRLCQVLNVAEGRVSQCQTSLFPLLILLSRLRPSFACNQWTLHPFIPGVFRICLRSPSLRIRELAASVAVSMAGTPGRDILLANTFTVLEQIDIPQNCLHAAMQCLFIMTKNVYNSPVRFRSWINKAEKWYFQWCTTNQILFLRILTVQTSLYQPSICNFINSIMDQTYSTPNRGVNLLAKQMAKFILASNSMAGLQWPDNHFCRFVFLEMIGSKMFRPSKEDLKFVKRIAGTLFASDGLMPTCLQFEGNTYFRKWIRACINEYISVGTTSWNELWKSVKRDKTRAALLLLQMFTSIRDAQFDYFLSISNKLYEASDCAQPACVRESCLTTFKKVFEIWPEFPSFVKKNVNYLGGLMNLLVDDDIKIRTETSDVCKYIVSDMSASPVCPSLALYSIKNECFNIPAAQEAIKALVNSLNMQTEVDGSETEKLFDRNEAHVFAEVYQLQDCNEDIVSDCQYVYQLAKLQ